MWDRSRRDGGGPVRWMPRVPPSTNPLLVVPGDGARLPITQDCPTLYLSTVNSVVVKSSRSGPMFHSPAEAPGVGTFGCGPRSVSWGRTVNVTVGLRTVPLSFR